VDQRELVERARRGDHDAFAELVERSIARLDTAARLIVRDPELARDAVQDALFRAWRDLRSLRDPDRFQAWLHRLTVNACLDQARRRRRRPIEVEVTDLHPLMAGDATDTLGDRELVNAVLLRLDERDRSIVVLHYYLGLSLTETAGAVGMPVGSVKTRLYRALGEMRAEIATDLRPLASSIAEGNPT